MKWNKEEILDSKKALKSFEEHKLVNSKQPNFQETPNFINHYTSIQNNYPSTSPNIHISAIKVHEELII